MKRLITCVLVLTVLFACKKNDDDNDNKSLFEGMYIGTFHRTGMDTSIVTLTFAGNSYSGFSDRSKYPLICNGSYEIHDNTISFADSCSWAANFDWTLILNGSYSFTRNNNELRFSRTNGNISDEYILKKVPR